MTRRPRNEQSVSLFPFLAVLLCAMGALLVLLVITTRMIRDEVARKPVKSASPPPAAPPTTVPEVEFDWRIVLGASEPLSLPTVPPVPPLVAPKPLFVRRDIPEPPVDLTSELNQFTDQIRQLQTDQSSLREELKAIRDRIESIRRDIDERQGILEKATSLSAAMNEEVVARNKEHSLRLAQLGELSQQLESLRSQLRQVNSRPRTAPNALKIIPYEGTRGTTRRPILIECVQDGLRFVPEEIELREPDLVGFAIEANPLLAGVKSLEKHWSRVDGVVAEQQRPYVLLVVRPDGIPAYYAARQLLQTYDQPFGYELLGTDQELALSAPDPEAQSTLRDAIAEMKKYRGRDFDVTASPFLKEGDIPRIDAGGTGRNANPNSSNGGGPARRGTGYRFVQTPRGLELIDSDGLPAALPARPESTVENTKSPRTEPSSSERPVIPQYRSVGPGTSSRGDSTPTTESTTVIESTTDSRTPPHKSASDASSPAGTVVRPHASRADQTEANSAASAILPPGLLDQRSGGGRGASGMPGQIGSPRLAYTREIVVVMSSDSLRIGDGETNRLAEGVSTEKLMATLVEGLREEVQQWGAPPEQFQWKPQVRFVIQPGGLSSFERVRPFFEKEKLISEIDFRFAAQAEEVVR